MILVIVKYRELLAPGLLQAALVTEENHGFFARLAPSGKVRLLALFTYLNRHFSRLCLTSGTEDTVHFKGSSSSFPFIPITPSIYKQSHA